MYIHCKTESCTRLDIPSGLYALLLLLLLLLLPLLLLLLQEATRAQQREAVPLY